MIPLMQKYMFHFTCFVFKSFSQQSIVKGLRWVVNPFDRQGGYISALEAIIFFGVNARERERFKIYGLLNTER